jgi:hypothetical protein
VFNNLISMDHLVHIAVLREQVTRNFLRRRNVIGCGVGLKIKDGQITGIPSVVVSVVRKEPPSQLSQSDLIPPVLDSVPTDVVETGPIGPLRLERQGPMRPVRPGVSIAHRNGTAGTLGCLVHRSGQPFLLSNNHVLALLNTARAGDVVLQPGPADGGTIDHAVGDLAAFELIRFIGEPLPSQPTPMPTPPANWLERLLQLLGMRSASQPSTAPSATSAYLNRVDAAIVRPYSSVQLQSALLDVNTPPSGIADPKLGVRVYKTGRSTGLTSGMITQVDVTVDVTYGSRTARYANQIMMTPFTQRGDSGALVIDEQRRAVGLVYSGSDKVTVACPIRFVLSALRVELVTG